MVVSLWINILGWNGATNNDGGGQRIIPGISPYFSSGINHSWAIITSQPEGWGQFGCEIYYGIWYFILMTMKDGILNFYVNGGKVIDNYEWPYLNTHPYKNIFTIGSPSNSSYQSPYMLADDICFRTYDEVEDQDLTAVPNDYIGATKYTHKLSLSNDNMYGIRKS